MSAKPPQGFAPQTTQKAFHVSWDQFHRDARALAWRLSDKAPFTGMVAVTRGGLVPAAIVARELNMRIIDTFCVQSYVGENTPGEVKVLKGVSPEIGRDAGRGLLVVDDLADTGATVKAVRALLPQRPYRDGLCKAARRPARRHLHHRGLAGHLDLFSLGSGLELSGADRGRMSAPRLVSRRRLSLKPSAVLAFVLALGLADVAKLVDARDLKSLDLGHTGSIPVVRTSLFGSPYVGAWGWAR